MNLNAPAGCPDHRPVSEENVSETIPEERFCGYTIRRQCWTIGGETFEFTWPADMDSLLDDPRTHQRFQADGYMPYWAQPWPGAVLLAEAVLGGELGGGRPAVEIGCGVGIVSVVAARKGWAVTAADYDEDALAFARLNADRNAVTLAGTDLIDFRVPPPVPAYDLILGSDLLYEKRNCEPVARWGAAALKTAGRAMLSDPNRSAAESFPDHARAVGLALRMEAVESYAPVGLLNRGRIWHVTHR